MEEEKRSLEREIIKNFDNPILHRAYANLLERHDTPSEIYFLDFSVTPTYRNAETMWESSHRSLTEKTIYAKANEYVQDYFDTIEIDEADPELIDLHSQIQMIITYLSNKPSRKEYSILMELLDEIDPEHNHEMYIGAQEIEI